MIEAVGFTASLSVFVVGQVWWGGSQARLHADYKSAVPAPALPSASRRRQNSRASARVMVENEQDAQIYHYSDYSRCRSRS